MTELRQKQPHIQCPGFLAFVRTRPCCACGAVGRTQAAHIRFASAIYGKRATGAGEKPSDRYCVPLCGPDLARSLPGCHAIQHSMNEQEFWLERDIDPLWVALQLWNRYHLENPEKIIAKPRAKRKIANRPFSKVHRPFRRKK